MRWCVEAVLRLGDRSIWHSCESHRSMHGTHPGPQLEMGGAWKINDHLGLSEKSIPTLIALPSFSYKMYRWHVQTLIFWPVSSAGTYSTHLGTPTKPVLMKWPTVLRLPNSDIDRAERTNIQLFTGPSWQMCLKNGYEFCCSLWGFGKIGCPLSQTNKNLKGNPIRPPAPILLSFTRSRPQWLGGVAVSPRPLLSSHPALFSGLESMFSFSQMQAK